MKNTIASRFVSTAALAAVGALLLAPFTTSRAAQADISSTPLTAIAAAQVKPNVMLLMDASGSMGWGHMPDEVEGVTGVGSVGYKNAQCNALYFNPSTTYVLPRKADGSTFAVPSFGAAPYAGYWSFFVAPDATDSSNVNLATSFQAYDRKTLRNTGTTPDTPQAAYYYAYTGTQTLNYANAPCTDTDSGATQLASGGGTWTRVVVGAAQQANFAVWYSYYRTRIALTKSAASLAFTPLTDSFRVGFITVEPKTSADAPSIDQAKYVEIHDFDSSQRATWFGKLFAQIPGGASPAREGLARVGRHYGNKHDLINTGMTGDPMQYSCQQNFTIMTTDGYWNTQTEASFGGPVQLDGSTLVGQQDNPLTPNSGNAPYPIFDGYANGSSVSEDNQVAYAYAACGSFAYQSTSQVHSVSTQILTTTQQPTVTYTQLQRRTQQVLATTTQNLQSTSQFTQATQQTLMNTLQHLQTTRQRLQTTSQNLATTTQVNASTNQNLQSTNQNIQSTAQTIQTAIETRRSITIDSQYTTQALQTTRQTTQTNTQATQSTSQRTAATSQNLQSTNQNLANTTQITKSTAQTLQSTAQNLQSTTQVVQTTTQPAIQNTTQTTSYTSNTTRSTSQAIQSTAQLSKSTLQVQACDARTELCPAVPANSCTPSAFVSCVNVTTGPTLVPSCTAQAADATNSFTATTCNSVTTGPQGVQSCTPQTANSTNNYVTITCNTTRTGPDGVAACSPITANAGNSWTNTTCNTSSSTPVGVATCSPITATSGNGWTATYCGTNNTGPTSMAPGSCTPQTGNSGNQYVTITCSGGAVSSGPAPSCTPASPTSVNGYLTVTCANNNTTNQAVQTCTPAGATSNNGYTTVTCSTNNSTPTAVQTCTPAAGTMGNGWVSTVCTPNNTGPSGAPACVASGPTSLNSWVTTTCGNNNQSNVPVATCSASGPTMANSWTTTTCPAPQTTTDVAVQSCAASSATSANNFTSTTCRVATSGPSGVSSCVPITATSGNNWVTTTCATVTGGPTGVQTCLGSGPTLGNSYVTTTCGNNNSGPTGVATCSNQSPNSGNGWVTINCGTNNTTNMPVATCVAASPDSTNAYTTTTCGANTTSPVDVDTCVPTSASSGNSYTATICATRTVSGPTLVASCTPVAPTALNGHRRTICVDSSVSTPVPFNSCVPNSATHVTCNEVDTGPTPVATCTPGGGTLGNQYVVTSCTANVTTNVPVATCVPAAALSSNNYTSVTCPTPVTTGPTPVPPASCTAAIPASSGNNWTSTSCSTNTVTDTAVPSCTNTPAGSGNSYTATACRVNSTGPTPVQASTCTSGTSPTSGNGYTTTTCSNNNTTNAGIPNACVAQTAASGNSWVTVTCPADVVSTPVGVASCTNSTGSAANQWVQTICTPNNSTPVGVAACLAVPASSGNNYTATVCANPTTTNVPVASCTPSGPTMANKYVTTTCSANNAFNTPVDACTPSGPTMANNYVTTTCPTPITTGPTAVATCVAVPSALDPLHIATLCDTAITGPTPVQSCTTTPADLIPTSGNNYTVKTCGSNNVINAGSQSCTPAAASSANNWVTTTCPTPIVIDTPVGSCAVVVAGTGNGWTGITCYTTPTGPTLVSSCTPDPASIANNWTATTCSTAGAKKITYQITKTITTSQLSGSIVIGTPTVATTVGATTDLDGICYPTNAPALPTPNPAPAGNGKPGPNPPTGCTAWPCVTTSTSPGGSVNSLADVAQYYYVTDLRPTMTNNVPTVGTGPEDDRLSTQHMTTFTIGLGVSGTLTYQSNYKDASTVTGDFADIRRGTKSWPLWPDPALDYTNYNNWNNPKSIDDFWHTAVNGRGQYFNATNPASVVSGLAKALAGTQSRTAAGAAVGVSNYQPVAGDNFVYLGSYVTRDWSGDVTASTFDLGTGAVGTTPSWKATDKLAGVTKALCDNRSIYLMRAGATNNLVNFSSGSQACDSSGNPTGTPDTGMNTAELANFDSTKVALLSQRPTMTTVQAAAAAGPNLVNFLRGQRGYEGFGGADDTKLYRSRTTALGDIVGSQPKYVKQPTGTYLDSGYAAFVAANASRTPMVYVGSNDGMLHAFYAGTTTTDTQGGIEAWAIVPSAMLPNLYKLADANYANTHQFFVDGSPVVADVYNKTTSTWRSMLVGGYNDGGKGYYAVDVTNPAAPKGMWEFKLDASTCYTTTSIGVDCHVGLSFGKPIVTKINDSAYAEGRWVVMVSSGYNNVRGGGLSGDGGGYLYVLDANTGLILYKIPTGAGDATTPSNLGQLNAYVDDSSLNNLSLRAYGGDMLGNIWNFDINNNEGATGREAILVGQAKDTGGTPQPITTRPELAELNGKPMVFVGTGRLLGTTDSTNAQLQSIYGIVDQLTGTSNTADLRTLLKPMVLAADPNDANARIVACSTSGGALCNSTKGWVIDLSDSGERVNVDMQLVLTTLVVASNVPTPDVCSAGGNSWLNYIDFATGEANGAFSGTPGGTQVSQRLSNSLSVGVSIIRLPSGQYETETTVAGANNPTGAGSVVTTPMYPPASKPTGKRVTWREITAP